MTNVRPWCTRILIWNWACTAVLAGRLPAVHGDEPTKSALEQNASGWIALFNGKDLAGWKRCPILPDKNLGKKNAWHADPQTRTIICDGVGVKEMLLHETVRTDGILHVEWRFKKMDEPTGYNAGIYFRTALDGAIWHQAQVAMVDRPPFVGDIFGDTIVEGKTKRQQVLGDGHKRVRPTGEWNTTEVTCQGKMVTVWMNGGIVTRWNGCEVAKGHPGLQAEYYYVEFRNVQYKPFE